MSVKLELNKGRESKIALLERKPTNQCGHQMLRKVTEMEKMHFEGKMLIISSLLCVYICNLAIIWTLCIITAK